MCTTAYDGVMDLSSFYNAAVYGRPV